MGRGGAMERFISACRNPLAKSATTKAIGYATQVPNASAKVLQKSDMAMGCPLTCGAVVPWLVKRRGEKRLNINLTPDGRLMVYMRKVELTRYFNPHAFANEVFTELANAKADLELV